ncbi:MAG: hypothetical protein LKE37_07405 [Atopobiaceae bacterium]|jgi:hypothetical protein|nr:hypothetical protein [Atopobiaceae bacterium]
MPASTVASSPVPSAGYHPALDMTALPPPRAPRIGATSLSESVSPSQEPSDEPEATKEPICSHMASSWAGVVVG